MKTTCGAYALRDVYGSEDAAIITKLLAAGLIIIGKANITVSDPTLCLVWLTNEMAFAGTRCDQVDPPAAIRLLASRRTGQPSYCNAVASRTILQTVSPYVKKPVKAGSKPLDHDAPGGSSSGSGVAVAAGLSVILDRSCAFTYKLR